MTLVIDRKRKNMEYLVNNFGKKLKIIDTEEESKSKSIFEVISKKRHRKDYEDSEDEYPDKKKANISSEKIYQSELSDKNDRINQLESKVCRLEEDVKILKKLFQVKVIETSEKNTDYYWNSVVN